MGPRKTDGNVHHDSVYGQSPAFELDNDAVNPLVIAYINNVRKEAVATRVTSFVDDNETQVVKHSADMYDDAPVGTVTTTELSKVVKMGTGPKRTVATDELISAVGSQFDSVKEKKTVLPQRLQLFNSSADIWLSWYNETRNTLSKRGFSTQEYSSEVLNLLLYHIKMFLEGSKEPNTGIRAHILNLLANHVVSGALLEENPWTIDEEWIVPTLSRLDAVRIKSIDDIKRCITGDYKDKCPRNYQQWTQFIRENEPTVSMFTTMVGLEDLWIIIKFMKVNWIKQIAKGASGHSTATLSMWLLYTLIYLPQNLPASDVSTIRDFAKKCRKLYLDKQVGTPSTNPTSFHIPLSKEFRSLGITSPDPDMGIFELVTLLASQTYGQRDLVSWDDIPPSS